MAERDSTKTPVAAEALIAAAPLALHRIPRGRPALVSGSARAGRRSAEPSERPVTVPVRPAPPAPARCTGLPCRPGRRPSCPLAKGRRGSVAGVGSNEGGGDSSPAGGQVPGWRALWEGGGTAGRELVTDNPGRPRASGGWSQTGGGGRVCESGKGL